MNLQKETLVTIPKECAAQMRRDIRDVLFRQYPYVEGKIVMCATYPTRGLYVADGLAQYILNSKDRNVDVSEYLSDMKYGDYLAMKATFGSLGKRGY